MSTGLTLIVDGKTIPVNPFVSDIIKNTIKGMVGTLKGAENPESIYIKIENVITSYSIHYTKLYDR